jgi:hypothetical protein
MIVGEATRWAKDEIWFKKLKNGLDAGWMKRWSKHPDVKPRLTKAKARPLEMARALAQHSENLLHYQVQTAEIFVGNGSAIWNEKFEYSYNPLAEGNDRADTRGQMIFITHPELNAEIDESDSSVDQTEEDVSTYAAVNTVPKLRGRGEKRKLVNVREADRDVVATKASVKTTIYAGNIMSGHKTIPGIITPGKSHDVRLEDSWGTTEPLSAVLPNGREITAAWIANGKGGSNEATGQWLIRHCVMPSLNMNSSIGETFIMPAEPAWRSDPSPDNWARRTENADEILYDRGPAGEERTRRGTLLADGLRDHFTAAAITEMAEPVQYPEEDLAAYGFSKRHPVDLALKPPHTSAILQTCDVKGFPEVKTVFRDKKAEQLAMNVAGINVVDGVPHNLQIIDGVPVRPPAGYSDGSVKNLEHSTATNEV